MICKVLVYTLRIFYAILEKIPLKHNNGDKEKIMKYDIKSLTLDEKLHLLTGKDTWRLTNANGKLPEVYLSDGPNGLRMHNKENPDITNKATAMPNIHVLANSWNTELAYLDGQTIADDCIEYNADVLLAPGVNIKRTPLCGRNFEYFSEDPFLAGTMAKAYIEGVQSKGIGTSLKHYCANNREYDRHFLSSEIDERTLREIYLPAFEIAVQAQPWTVMCSYNLINGVWASESEWLLEDVLRGEFGFEGIVVSDWGATHHAVRAAKAGLDLTMPYRAESFDELKAAYENGFLTDAEIDRNVTRLLAFIEKTQNSDKKITTTKEQRHENAVKIAQEGIVLLKNDDNILPLTGGKIYVCGVSANQPPMGGGGSAYVQTEYRQATLLEEIKNRLSDPNSMENEEYQDLKYSSTILHDGHLYNGTHDLQAAKKADIVVYCMGNNQYIELEARDRTNIQIPSIQVDVLKRIATINPNVVVVLHAGSAIDVSEWIDLVKAVVYVGFAGEAANEAAADILTGKVSPSGKLAETFPLNLESAAVGKYEGNGFVDRYSEGIFVGYRYYDSFNKQVAFPFGFGLSYAAFEYSDLQVKKESETDYEISYVIKNVGSVAAKEISQVYVRDVFASVSRPQKELKGFSKDLLQPGESKKISMKLNARAFAYYSLPKKAWHVENGEFEILVGASSRDIRLSTKIEIRLPETEQFSRQ